MLTLVRVDPEHVVSYIVLYYCILYSSTCCIFYDIRLNSLPKGWLGIDPAGSANHGITKIKWGIMGPLCDD